jgi:hypothetical protein
MRAIYFLPSGLLLLLCVLNFYLGFITEPAAGFVVYFAFGLVYLAIGVLMISRFRFAEFLGLIFSLAILFSYPLLVGFEKMNPWSSGIMGGVNAIIFISCLMLLLLKVKN